MTTASAPKTDEKPFALLGDVTEEATPDRSRINPEENPFVELLRRSAEKLTSDSTDKESGLRVWRGTFLGVEVANDQSDRATYLIRNAAEYLGWGANIVVEEGSKKSQTKIKFAAKSKKIARKSDENVNGAPEESETE